MCNGDSNSTAEPAAAATNGVHPVQTTANGTHPVQPKSAPYQSIQDYLSNVAKYKIIESTLREGEQFANAFFDTETKIKMYILDPAIPDHSKTHHHKPQQRRITMLIR